MRDKGPRYLGHFLLPSRAHSDKASELHPNWESQDSSQCSDVDCRMQLNPLYHDARPQETSLYRHISLCMHYFMEQMLRVSRGHKSSNVEEPPQSSWKWDGFWLWTVSLSLVLGEYWVPVLMHTSSLMENSSLSWIFFSGMHGWAESRTLLEIRLTAPALPFSRVPGLQHELDPSIRQDLQNGILHAQGGGGLPRFLIMKGSSMVACLDSIWTLMP